MRVFTKFLQNSRMIQRCVGFTLAEVLIALAIVGVIAVITIPILLSKIQEQQYIITWKKEFSMLNQAIIGIASDNGGTIANLCTSYNSDCFRTYLQGYLKSPQSCSSLQTLGKCFHAKDGSAKYYNGNPIDGSSWDFGGGNTDSGMILSDGSLIYVQYRDPQGGTVFGSSALVYGILVVDTNGFKGPNIAGKDIFKTLVLSSKLEAMGDIGTPSYKNDCSSTATTGWGCAAAYLSK